MCDVKKYEEFRRFAIFRNGEVVRLSQTLPKWIEGKGIIQNLTGTYCEKGKGRPDAESISRGGGSESDHRCRQG